LIRMLCAIHHGPDYTRCPRATQSHSGKRVCRLCRPNPQHPEEVTLELEFDGPADLQPTRISAILGVV
jgi:hypothetical protein